MQLVSRQTVVSQIHANLFVRYLALGPGRHINQLCFSSSVILIVTFVSAAYTTV